MTLAPPAFNRPIAGPNGSPHPDFILLLQELIAKINALEARIEALEAP